MCKLFYRPRGLGGSNQEQFGDNFPQTTASTLSQRTSPGGEMLKTGNGKAALDTRAYFNLLSSK
jgi:hypothetical protein